MAKEASLRICKANVELLTERYYLDMVEPAIHAGFTSEYKNRRFENNQYFSNYNSSDDASFVFCVNANNLYCGVLQFFELPLSEFAFNSEITNQLIGFRHSPQNQGGLLCGGWPFMPTKIA